MINMLLYLWQLPQNIIGLIVVKALRAEAYDRKIGNNVYRYYQASKFSFGVSLGKYIIIGSKYGVRDTTILHETGHQIQSKILGPLYLIVIGLPSAINCLINKKIKYDPYAFYTEAWADNLMGVKR